MEIMRMKVHHHGYCMSYPRQLHVSHTNVVTSVSKNSLTCIVLHLYCTFLITKQVVFFLEYDNAHLFPKIDITPL